MTEEEWLTGEDLYSMLREGVVPTLSMSRPRSREFELACAACARLIWHLLPDKVKSAVEWREATAGRAYEENREAWEAHTRNLSDASSGPGSPEGTGSDRMPDPILASYIVEAAWHQRLDIAFIHLYRLAPTGRPADTQQQLANILRDIFGNPCRPVAFDPAWRTTDATLLATGIYEEKAFDRMPILADALQDAGCDSDALLTHLRDANATHVRGCWALDRVLGKE